MHWLAANTSMRFMGPNYNVSEALTHLAKAISRPEVLEYSLIFHCLHRLTVLSRIVLTIMLIFILVWRSSCYIIIILYLNAVLLAK